MTIWNITDKLKLKLESQIKSDKKIIELSKNTQTIKIYKENIIRMQNALNFGVLVGGINDEGLHFRNI
jgi:hypothetical protein